MLQFIVLATILSVAAAKYAKPIEEYFKDFAGEPGINLITAEDDSPPNTFVGNVMQAKITQLTNSREKGKFNYK